MVELSWTCYDNEYFIGAEPHKVRKSQKTSQLIQAMGDGSVQQQNANGQTNQVWKAEDTGNSRYKFTTQDGTSRVIKTPAGNFGEGLVLTGYTGDGFQQWAVQQNGSTGFVRVIATNNNTWGFTGGRQ